MSKVNVQIEKAAEFNSNQTHKLHNPTNFRLLKLKRAKNPTNFKDPIQDHLIYRIRMRHWRRLGVQSRRHQRSRERGRAER
jgi:hypothetical protein